MVFLAIYSVCVYATLYSCESIYNSVYLILSSPYYVLNNVLFHNVDLQILKVWDIKDQTCLQSVFIKFPISSGAMGRLPEFGPFSMHLHQPSKTVLVTANDYIAMLKLGQSNVVNSNQVITHESSLSNVVYNPLFDQVRL